MYLGLPNLGLDSYQAGGPALSLDFVSTETPDGRLTISGGTGGTRVNSSGTIVSASAPRYDYDPSTLAALGLLVEEQRTNSIRNNSMTGAVAGVARTIGTISGLSRSASTTVVVASTGHNVAVNDMISVSGANVAAYNGTYAVSAVVANVSYSYVVASSATDSATGYTVAVQSPGTLPTNWASTNTQGLALSVVGTGTESGIVYVDFRYAGLSTGVLITFREEQFSIQAASNGQTWANSKYVRVSAGSSTNVGTMTNDAQVSTAATPGTVLATYLGATYTPTTAGLATQRYSSGTLTVVDATAAWIIPRHSVSIANAAMIDITLRIGYPQLELGSFATSVIPTTIAAVTRTADSVTMTGANFSSWFNARAGTFVCSFQQPSAGNSGFFPSIFSVRQSGADSSLNTIESFIIGSTLATQSLVRVASVDQFATTFTAPAAASTARVAMAYAANNFGASFNHAAAVLDVSGTLPTSIDTFHLGVNVATYINTRIRSLTYYSRALITELPTL